MAVLLENTVILWSAVQFAKRFQISEKIAVLIVGLVVVLQPCEWFGLAYIARQFPYFAHQYQQTKPIGFTRQIAGDIVLSGIIFAPLALMWNRTTYPDCFSFALSVETMAVLSEIYTFIVAVADICFVSGLVYYGFPHCIKMAFALLGSYSLESYCLQGFFYRIITGFSPLQNTIIEIVLISVLVVFIPWLLEKNQLLAFILFGKRSSGFLTKKKKERI